MLESSTGNVLALTDEVMTQLKQKHPNPQPAKLGTILFGPVDDDIPESVYFLKNQWRYGQASCSADKGARGSVWG